MNKILKEFKEFAVKGNVMDLAIGVIIGGAFGKIVTSLVNDVIMPAVGLLVGGVDFSSLAVVLQPEVLSETGEIVTAAVSLNYGVFINTVIDFAIVAFVIFMVIKGMNRLKRKEEEKPKEEKHPTQVELLVEIRDLLKK
jgi:large conductance mechanosensitive channel